MPEKWCNKCRKWKGLEDFYKDKTRKGEKACYCKECQNQYLREYNPKHKEEIKQNKKRYREKNRKKIAQSDKKYKQEHKEEIEKYQKKWQEENRKKIAKNRRKSHRKHREKENQYCREYRAGHKEEHNEYTRNRYKTNPCFRLNNFMSKAILQTKNPSIKQGRSWKDLVPYTVIQLKKHLERTLPEGYIWEDFMQGKLHIDHIHPKAIFEYEKAEDLGFQVCWSLDNLRLLPAKENIRKKAKLIKPFQKHFDIEVKIKK